MKAPQVTPPIVASLLPSLEPPPSVPVLPPSALVVIEAPEVPDSPPPVESSAFVVVNVAVDVVESSLLPPPHAESRAVTAIKDRRRVDMLGTLLCRTGAGVSRVGVRQVSGPMIGRDRDGLF